MLVFRGVGRVMIPKPKRQKGILMVTGILGNISSLKSTFEDFLLHRWDMLVLRRVSVFS